MSTSSTPIIVCPYRENTATVKFACCSLLLELLHQSKQIKSMCIPVDLTRQKLKQHPRSQGLFPPSLPFHGSLHSFQLSLAERTDPSQKCPIKFSVGLPQPSYVCKWYERSKKHFTEPSEANMHPSEANKPQVACCHLLLILPHYPRVISNDVVPKLTSAF